MTDKTKPLFREQVTTHRRRGAYGQVVLKSSLSSWVITALLAIIIISGGLYLTLSSVETDSGPIALWQWLRGLS